MKRIHRQALAGTILAILGICAGVNAQSHLLTSSQLPSLPDPLGVAAPFAGVTGGSLLVAGGANFPNGFPWENGKKVWYDRVYLLSDEAGPWKTIGKLPRPLAYGISITTPGGIVCIGGGDAEKHYADCFRLNVKNGKLPVETLPNLPGPLAYAAGALVGQTIYVAGGSEQPGEQSASKEFYALNLGATARGWKKLSPCPGPPRILPVAAVVGSDFFLVGGAALEPTNGAIARVYLRDAWRFRPDSGWEKIPDLPRPAVAAPSPAPGAGSSFFVLGGDDGSLRDFKPPEKHPGFPKKILAYDTITKTWSEAGESPVARVTTTTVFWKKGFVVPSGEVRPGVRSPEVWWYAVANVAPTNQSLLIKSIEVSTPLNASDDVTYWMQARAAVLPEEQPPGKEAATPIVITLQKTDRVGTHMYHGLSAMWTDTLGKWWYDPVALPTVDRIVHTNGLLEAPVDMTPQFHKKTGKLLATGATFWQDKKLQRDIPGGPSDTAYSVYDLPSRRWSPWQKLAMPDEKKFHFARAGCSQRVDLPNGDILLPIYFRPKGSDDTLVTVVRCKFDGATLSYVEHGTELNVTNDNPKIRKGLHEPSLTFYGGKYLLTLRNDERGYISTSDDGLHFSQPKPWKFDDGSELGSYNTQQHWVTHSDGLFLAYTRRGADNDKVMRHRAPLFLARVDPKKLVVERATEKILLPNLGKAFGNFGVCNISPEETWVVDCLVGAEADKPNLFIAKIRWTKPNRAVAN